MMAISSIAPLFLLWAVRGMHPIPDHWLVPLCATLALAPNGVLLIRIQIARRRGDRRTISVNRADDHRDHLLVYLFAMLLPLYDVNVGRVRDSLAAGAALAFIIFLFWHLDLYYMNICFAVFGFRVFSLEALGSQDSLVLLTKRRKIDPNTKVHAYRLSDTVFFEA